MGVDNQLTTKRWKDTETYTMVAICCLHSWIPKAASRRACMTMLHWRCLQVLQISFIAMGICVCTKSKKQLGDRLGCRPLGHLSPYLVNAGGLWAAIALRLGRLRFQLLRFGFAWFQSWGCIEVLFVAPIRAGTLAMVQGKLLGSRLPLTCLAPVAQDSTRTHCRRMPW